VQLVDESCAYQCCVEPAACLGHHTGDAESSGHAGYGGVEVCSLTPGYEVANVLTAKMGKILRRSCVRDQDQQVEVAAAIVCPSDATSAIDHGEPLVWW